MKDFKWNDAELINPTPENVYLVSVDGEVCGSEQDFVSTDWYEKNRANKIDWSVYGICVRAWAPMPEIYDLTKENDDWIVFTEESKPTKDGTYIVTARVSSMLDDDSIPIPDFDDMFVIDVIDGVFDGYGVFSMEDDECDYEVLAWMPAPEVFVPEN